MSGFRHGLNHKKLNSRARRRERSTMMSLPTLYQKLRSMALQDPLFRKLANGTISWADAAEEYPVCCECGKFQGDGKVDDKPKGDKPVSYTHLTLPTIYSV